VFPLLPLLKNCSDIQLILSGAAVTEVLALAVKTHCIDNQLQWDTSPSFLGITQKPVRPVPRTP
jgi:hypothetical protein